ncbi:MAG: Sec-independent protein translocase protein TatC [Planctomycetaceae bacterium]|nr:MAG: Sec-independent protein translocase protein TatC [Planctomycetaceae bacterium]
MKTNSKKKDLFDDSVMTFGEHLECLRMHLIKALIGLGIAMIITMIFGEQILRWIREPIDDALERYSVAIKREVSVQDDVRGFQFWTTIKDFFKNQFLPNSTVTQEEVQAERQRMNSEELQRVVTIQIPLYDLAEQIHQVDPQRFPPPEVSWREKRLTVDVQSEDFAGLRRAVKKIDDPITLNVQEAFMTYIKVSLISGLVLSSPWIFYQLWLFVAAGLYPHERRYVYTYLPISVGLFLGGVFFCYYAVFPTILDFLLGFNIRLGLTAQIRISEWINFAILMPVLFGVSFQLPLAMLFMQKISLFSVADYREKRRLAILAISFLAMILTPTPDPMSMILMMLPMLGLYELGIWLCVLTQPRQQEETAIAT